MNAKHSDEILKHVDVLLEVVPSPASTQRAMRRTESALLGATEEQPTASCKPWWKRSVPRAVICAVVAASVMITASLVQLNNGGRVTFAAVQEQMRRAPTVTYTAVEWRDGKPLATQWMVSGKGTRREESNGDIHVTNLEQGLSMTVNATERSVVIHHNAKDSKDRRAESNSLYDTLRTLHHDAVMRIGERQIDGKTTVGFVVPEIGVGNMAVWVDKETQLPVLVEASGNRVLQDFAFDQPLDDGLFAMQWPGECFVEHRYRSPQQPISLLEEELASLRALLEDSDRSARKTADGFLRLAMGGHDDEASRLLQIEGELDGASNHVEFATGIRRFHEFDELEIVAMYAAPQAALAITSKVNFHGEECSLVIGLSFKNDQWSITGMDMRSKAVLKEDIDRFLVRHPEAKVIAETEPK